MNITPLIDKIRKTVLSHRLADGVYARYLWQNPQNTRKMGINEYGCADAANILYTIGDFAKEPAERAEWVKALRNMQNPETGLFYEDTHHPIHTTAHCLAALELFDAQPLYPLNGLMKYLDKEELYRFLDSLNWEGEPWPQSHRGAGLFAAMAITNTCSLSWKRDYFAYFAEKADPETGLGLKGRHGSAPMCHQLYGWFHYFFNHEYAHMPIPHPEKLIDTCIDLYKNGGLTERFGKMIGFMEIDWVFAMNRAARLTPHRFFEVKALLRDFAKKYFDYLNHVDTETDDLFNDLHSLFGAVCAIAELQIALPGEIETEIPLKIVLDRRPFI